MQNVIAVIVSIAIAQLTGFVGALVTQPALPVWYAGLVKPSIAPPDWIFAPVWTTLFTLMGIAAFLVWNKRHSQQGAKRALGAYTLQLALNFVWSYLFFGRQNTGAAFIEILILLVAIVWAAKLFYRIDRLAAYLLIPYIAWVSFAAILNFGLWRLN